MILGSDDVVCKNYINTMHSYIKAGYRFMGKKEWVALDIKSNANTDNNADSELYKLTYGEAMEMSIGSGRIYSKKFLDTCDWLIFDFLRNKGLDEYGHYQLKNTKAVGVISECKDHIYILSLKGDWDQMNSLAKIRDVADMNDGRIEMKKLTSMYGTSIEEWLKDKFGTDFHELTNKNGNNRNEMKQSTIEQMNPFDDLLEIRDIKNVNMNTNTNTDIDTNGTSSIDFNALD